MSFNAAALELMAAKGLSIADVIEIAKAMETRSKAAERQANYRERKKRDVTRDVTERDASPSLDKETPQTPKEIKPIPCARETRARAYHRLPEGWVPARPLPSKLQAKVDEWPPGAVDDELAAFHRWALNAENKQGRGLKKDWDAAWHNWIERRHDERYRKSSNGTNGMGRARPDPEGLGVTARAAVAVFGPPERSGRSFEAGH